MINWPLPTDLFLWSRRSQWPLLADRWIGSPRSGKRGPLFWFDSFFLLLTAASWSPYANDTSMQPYWTFLCHRYCCCCPIYNSLQLAIELRATTLLCMLMRFESNLVVHLKFIPREWQFCNWLLLENRDSTVPRDSLSWNWTVLCWVSEWSLKIALTFSRQVIFLMVTSLFCHHLQVHPLEWIDQHCNFHNRADPPYYVCNADFAYTSIPLSICK